MSADKSAVEELREEVRWWQEWSNELTELIPEDDVGIYANPDAAQESIISDCFRAYKKERDDVRAGLDVEALACVLNSEVLDGWGMEYWREQAQRFADILTGKAET